MSMDNYILVKEVKKDRLYKIYEGCASGGSKNLVATTKSLRDAVEIADSQIAEYGISFDLK